MRTPNVGKQFSSKDSFLVIGGCILFLLAGLIHQQFTKPPLELKKQDTAVNINKDLLIFMSAGNKRLLADLFWVHTLLESDLEHYAKQDLKDWMYLRFKTISILDPLFYENYAWGGQYLTVAKDDIMGGNDLMESGLKYYPDDYKLHFLLGFSYYYELGDYDKGIYYYEKIMDHPRSPHYLRTIVNKMKVEKGFDYEVALTMIRDQIEDAKDEELKDKLKKDLYSLKAERDLKCLNNNGSKCDLYDSEGKAYILKGDQYYTYRHFRPFRLAKKGQRTKAIEVNTMK